MADFKIAYRIDAATGPEGDLTWEEGCPLLIEAIQVSRDVDTGEAYLQGKLTNLSGQVAQSLKAVIVVSYEDGTTETVEFNPLDADIPSGAAYALKPVKLQRGDVAGASGTVESVRLAGGEWQTSSSPGAVPKPAPIGLSEDAIDERCTEVWKASRSPLSAEAAKTAAANRLVQHDGWWLCPCGQLNVGRDACAECGVPLSALQKPGVEDEKVLKEKHDQRISEEERMREAEAAEKEQRRRQTKRRLSKALKISIPALAAIVACVLVVVFLVVPNMKYSNASNLAESANSREGFQAAYDAFVELGDFNDAPDRAKAVALSAGEVAEGAGDVEQAVDWYGLIGDDGNVNRAKYAYVEAAQGDYDQLAYTYLSELAEIQYEDAPALLEKAEKWTFDFSLVSFKEYDENGREWTSSSSVRAGSLGSGEHDSAGILIMPKGGAPGGKAALSLAIYEIDGKSQITYTGEWRYLGTETVYFGNMNGKKFVQEPGKSYADEMDKPFVYLNLGNNAYDDAWRVVVTDTETGEKLFEGEIFESE